MVDAANHPPRPHALAVKPEHIPEQLKAFKQWVVWRYTWLEDRQKWDKPPLNARTGKPASSTNPKTWSTFEQALACYQKNQKTLDGIGLVLCKDNHLIGVDLDHCYWDPGEHEPEEVEPWADELVNAFDTYTEVSVSGTGLHMFAIGTLPGGKGLKKGPIEIYQAARYLTVTGNRIVNMPATIEPRQDALNTLYAKLKDKPKAKPHQAPHANGEPPRLEDEQLLEKALAARNGAKLARLWAGDIFGYPSQSEADLALCTLLAFWTQDEAQLDRLFRQSRLMRDKWGEFHGEATYGQMTIRTALEQTTEHYHPPKRRRPHGTHTTAAVPNGTPPSPQGDAAPAHEQTPATPQERKAPRRETLLLTDFPKSDQLNAEFLVLLHGTDLHFCHPWKRWLVWDGQRWQVDATAEVMRHAKATLSSLLGATEFVDDKQELSSWLRHIQSSFSTGRLKGMVELAASEKGIPVLPDKLDCEPWALNCRNGVVDLCTGELRAHARGDLFTKVVPVAYDPDATCPRWEKFLQEIFKQDQALITFIQRAVGYSLTGDTRERALFICWGTGRNGKSTFLEIVAELLGDYAMRTPTRTLMEKRNPDQIPNDVAALKGMRFVHASESGEGQRLDEEFIKDVTGRDTLSARFLHGEWFNFKPVGKLWLRTNHKPVIRGTDPAIWDRPRLIPFVERFEGREDKGLPAALRTELPGILAWAVQGCLSWQINGLVTPAAVQQATDTYRKDMDVIGDFLADCCTLAPYASVTSKNLTAAYRHWCDQNNEHQINSTAFGRRLLERGCQSGQGTHGVRLWRGIGLKMSPPE
jgi:putative DNA primase/helicase